MLAAIMVDRRTVQHLIDSAPLTDITALHSRILHKTDQTWPVISQTLNDNDVDRSLKKVEMKLRP